MATKKSEASNAAFETQIGTSVANCTFTTSSAANEHTRAAVEALAAAVGRNADAIAEIARALKGGTINSTGVHVGGN